MPFRYGLQRGRWSQIFSSISHITVHMTTWWPKVNVYSLPRAKGNSKVVSRRTSVICTAKIIFAEHYGCRHFEALIELMKLGSAVSGCFHTEEGWAGTFLLRGVPCLPQHRAINNAHKVVMTITGFQSGLQIQLGIPRVEGYSRAQDTIKFDPWEILHIYFLK